MISKVFFDGWIGVAPYEKKFKIAPAEPWFGSRLKDRLFLNEPRATFFSVMSDTSGVCNRFLDFKPKLVTGGTAFRMLADFMANRVGRSDWLRGVAVWGMPLLPDDARTISKGFCDNIYDRYGSAELSGSVAQQCHDKTGLHVNTEMSFIEVLKGNEPCQEGERGRIVITNLRNLAAPFIRYEQEDEAVFLDDCPCGRQLPMISAIRGERKDTSPVQMRDGIRIPQATLHTFLRTLRESEHVEQFSFSKPSSQELLLTIQPGEGFTAQSAERIRAKLSEAIGSLAAVSIKISGHVEHQNDLL
jgi:phenylacetate-coenzyme A ligase PaaK-like adenylate-forming protein